MSFLVFTTTPFENEFCFFNNIAVIDISASGADIAIEGNLMKMDITSGAADWDGEMIFRGDRREMVVVDHMKEMNGFPVVTREYGDGGVVVTEATLKGSRSATFSPGDFEPPKKYKHKDMMKPLNR